jgi:hypothetical protein
VDPCGRPVWASPEISYASFAEIILVSDRKRGPLDRAFGRLLDSERG